MKTNYSLPVLFLLVCIGASCLDQAAPPPASISATMVKNSFFDMMENLLTRAGLIIPLSNPNPNAEAQGYTLFSPTDQAFRELENNSGRSLDSFRREFIREMLQGHLHDGRIGGSKLSPGLSIPTENESSLTIRESKEGVFVNGAKLVFTDATASNGVLHGLDKVVFHGDKTIIDWIRAFSNGEVFHPSELNLFNYAIELAGMADDINSASELLVFAPSNLAFHKMGIQSEGDLENLSPHRIREIVANHFFDCEKIFSQELNTKQVKNLNGVVVGIESISRDSVVFEHNENQFNVSFIIPDITGNPGVIFIIYTVLGQL